MGLLKILRKTKQREKEASSAGCMPVVIDSTALYIRTLIYKRLISGLPTSGDEQICK